MYKVRVSKLGGWLVEFIFIFMMIVSIVYVIKCVIYVVRWYFVEIIKICVMVVYEIECFDKIFYSVKFFL